MKLVSTFSERLKEILEIREIKPSKLAELVDINKSTISQYLNGEYEPKRKRIELFAKTLNVNEAWLIGYDVDMKRETQPKKQEESNMNKIISQLTPEELSKLEKFNNMSTVMFMNEGNDISDEDRETLAIAYAEVLISQRKK